MASRKSSPSATHVLHDIHRDWRGWSGAERFAAKLAGLATASIGLLISWPYIL